MKKNYSFLFVALISLCLASCNKVEPSSLVGAVYETPEDYDMKLTFNTTTTCILSVGYGDGRYDENYATYSVQGDKITLVPSGVVSEQMEFLIKENGNLLMLTMGEGEGSIGDIPFYKK